MQTLQGHDQVRRQRTQQTVLYQPQVRGGGGGGAEVVGGVGVAMEDVAEELRLVQQLAGTVCVVAVLSWLGAL